MMRKHIGCIRLIFLCPLSLSLKPDWLCVISWFKIFNLQFLFPTESTLVLDFKKLKVNPKIDFLDQENLGPPKK